MSKSKNELRKKSVRLLIGIFGGTYGAPAAKCFLDELGRNGYKLDDSTLSNILCNKRQLDDAIAEQIELSLKLPCGWLSVEHDSGLFADLQELRWLNLFKSLPTKTREAVGRIVMELAITKGDVSELD